MNNFVVTDYSESYHPHSVGAGRGGPSGKEAEGKGRLVVGLG